MTHPKRTAIAAVGVALVAFFLYHSTLLPGLDFGDTPSFQVMGGDPAITPRDAYPLYFAVGAPFVWLTGDRAHGLNLASAVEGAAAAGLIVLAAAELSGSLFAAVAAALLFAGSYTFWSQSIITEVYALHMCMVSLSVWLLLRWESKPSLARLAAFFAAYAVGFGDHLAMVLLLPGYTLFLLIAAPGGWRTMLTPRIICLATGIAALGALQYAWNLHNLWLAPIPPESFTAALGRFWFDVTKSDWRESMVASVPRMMAGERLRMYAFDVRQQFGLLGPALAAIGMVQLARDAPRRAYLFAVLFIVNVGFALSYNVGDSHVFFLPSHLILALLFAPALALLDSLAFLVPSALAVCLAVWSFYVNYPALDRSADTRPTDLLAALTSGLDDAHAVLLTDLNWQAANGLTYFTKAVRRDLAVASLPDVLPHAGQLIADNLAIGREVVLSDKARSDLSEAYGPRFHVVRDTRAPAPSLSDTIIGLPGGTRYVLTILRPPRGLSIDMVAMSRALQLLGAASAIDLIGRDDYMAIAGLTGAPPSLVRSSTEPFREHVVVDGVGVDIRMESWLAFDTIRRMGFGQVVAAHHHTLIAERGVSFAAFSADGHALRQVYAASLFAPERRWAIVSP